MGGPSKQRQWSETSRHAEQRARETRFVADVAACDAWNYRMEGYGGPAQPSPPIGDALNAGFRYLEVKCAGCDTHSTVDLTTLRLRERHPSGSLSSGCAAGPAQRSAAIRSSAATWSGFGGRTSRRGKSLGIPATSGIGIDKQSWLATRVR